MIFFEIYLVYREKWLNFAEKLGLKLAVHMLLWALKTTHNQPSVGM